MDAALEKGVLVRDTILVDTREQHPYTFSRWQDKVYVVKDTLTVGDYSILRYQDHVAVERKSLSDFYRSIGSERSRVMKALRRLANVAERLFVVESTATSVFDPGRHKFTRLHRNQVLGTVTSMIVDLGIPVMFADTRRMGEEIVYQFLVKAAARLTSKPEGASIPALFVKTYSYCSMCGKTRPEALRERPDLSITAWVRIAKKVDKYKRTVLGDRLAVCYECRKRIRKREAVMPPNYKWER